MVAGGGPISEWPGVVSRDGKVFIAPAAKNVNIYSTQTGALINTLRGHTQNVTAIQLNPKKAHQLYTTSYDGTLRVWDLNTLEQLQSHAIGGVAAGLVLPANTDLAILSVRWNQNRAGRIFYFNTAKGKLLPQRTRLSRATPLAVSTSGDFFATFDKHTLMVWSVAHLWSKPLTLHHTRPFMSLALDAGGERVAAGDCSGRILIWHGVRRGVAAAREAAPLPPAQAAQPRRFGPEAALALTTWHWHAHPVLALAFSVDDAFLMSAGEEAVVVGWQLPGGKRAYLPRLGATISSLATDPSDPARFLLTHLDNTLRLVNMATMKVEAAVHGVRPPPRQALAAPVVALVPGSGELVLGGPASLLQFHDPLSDRHLAQLQVSPRNIVSLTESERATFSGAYGPPVEPQVTLLAFGRDGGGMATVDVMPDAGPGGSATATLRFWDRAGSGGHAGTAPRYELNTQIAEPHRGVVSALAYHPSTPLAVTAGTEGDFRIWARTAGGRRPGATGQSHHWVCRCVGSYQERALTAAAFSGDGSALAVAAGEVVTLWDPTVHVLLTTLLPPPAADGTAFAHLAFAPGTQYLVAASGADNASWLVVWDLLEAVVAWAMPLRCAALAADPSCGLFAVAAVPRAGTPGFRLCMRDAPPVANAALPTAHGTRARRKVRRASAGAAGDGGPQPRPANGPVAAYEDGGQQLDAGEGYNGAAEGHENDDEAGGEAALAGAPHEAGMPAAGMVLMFHPAKPIPRHAWVLEHAAPAALLFAPERSPLAAAGAELAPAGTTPLLVLTRDRLFALARGMDGGPMSPPAANVPSHPEQPALGYEAAFGPLRDGPAAAAAVILAGSGAGGAAEGKEAAGAEAAAARGWRALFDAPSHALPPLSALCPAFLEVMLREDAVG